MQKRIIQSLFLTFLTLSNAFGQIVGSEEEKVKNKEVVEEVEEPKEPRAVDGSTMLYFNTNWSKTSRTLEPNGELFGKELGTRANETSANFWSYSLGIRSVLGKHFEIEAGLGFMRNGEKYAFEEIDTFYYYTTTYRFITMPVVGYYTYGKDIKLMAGVGIVPQLFMNETQDIEWKTKNNTKYKDDIKVKSGTQKHASFMTSALFRLGVQFKYSDYWSIYFMPEYRMQLTNTYGNNSPYIHKANALGFNLGLTVLL